MANQASSLQHFPGMRRFAVAILSAVALWGCGVGVDDPEGQAAAGPTTAASAQALTSAQEGENKGSVTAVDASPRLPQDPIPIKPAGRPDPSQGPGPFNPRG